MKYEIVMTSAFKKALKIIKKRHKDLSKLTNVVTKLANDIALDDRNKDHKLISNDKYQNVRECHIEPDWLLVYRKEDDDLVLLLIETGSHSDLF